MVLENRLVEERNPSHDPSQHHHNPSVSKE
jgi:hypothetical protein